MEISNSRPAVEIETLRVSAYDFAIPISEGVPSATFGSNKNMATKALRALADAIERDDVYVTKARVMTTASAEDFASSVLRLSFIEKVRVKKEQG